LIEVTTSPLEVNKVSLINLQVVGSKVVFNSRIGLDDVTTTTTNTQVDNTTSKGNGSRTRENSNYVRAVLEGTAVLVGVKSQGVVVLANRNDRVLLDGGSLVIEARVDHLVIGINVLPCVVVTGRDVVAQTEDTVLTFFSRRQRGDDPTVDVGHTRARVTQMVVSVPLSGEAVGSRQVPSRVFSPNTIISSAANRVVVLRNRTQVTGFNVLRLRFVVIAASNVRGNNSNILPWGRVPVRIVITLFRAFKARSSTVVILTSVGSRTVGVQVTTEDAIGSKKTVVSAAKSAVAVELVGFVHTVHVFAVSIFLVTSLSLRDSLVSNTITYFSTTHVLQDVVAINIVVATTATVLRSPFDLKNRSVVESQSLTPAITTSGIVLGVHKSVLGNSVSRRGIESVV
jgi:hypothetical protein